MTSYFPNYDERKNREMIKLMKFLTAFKELLKTYPALSAALVNFGVFVAGYFGLHITASQLVMYVGVADVLFGLVVHSNVVPLNKVVAANKLSTLPVDKITNER